MTVSMFWFWMVHCHCEWAARWNGFVRIALHNCRDCRTAVNKQCINFPFLELFDIAFEFNFNLMIDAVPPGANELADCSWLSSTVTYQEEREHHDTERAQLYVNRAATVLVGKKAVFQNNTVSCGHYLELNSAEQFALWWSIRSLIRWIWASDSFIADNSFSLPDHSFIAE